MNALPTTHRQKGFTLAEILIALILLTAISLVMLDISRPWFNLKAEMDTSTRLGAIESALLSLYEPAAFTMETPPDPASTDKSWMALAGNRGNFFYGYLSEEASPTLGPIAGAFTYVSGKSLLTEILPDKCNTAQTLEFWKGMPGALSIRVDHALRDGHGQPICLLLGEPRYLTMSGVRVYYHQLYAVSAGRNGKFEATSKIDPVTGALALAGDDRGVTISGLELQQRKFIETQQRLQTAAAIYERYFTMRYLSTNTREVVYNYFTDKAGPVREFVLGDALLDKRFNRLRVTTEGSTDQCGAGTPPCSLDVLGVVGVTAESPWESYPAIGLAGVEFDRSLYMANAVDHNAATTDEKQIRVPQPFPTDPNSYQAPPYTALIFTFIPGPFDGEIPRYYGVNAYGRY